MQALHLNLCTCLCILNLCSCDLCMEIVCNCLSRCSCGQGFGYTQTPAPYTLPAASGLQYATKMWHTSPRISMRLLCIMQMSDALGPHQFSSLACLKFRTSYGMVSEWKNHIDPGAALSAAPAVLHRGQHLWSFTAQGKARLRRL